MQVVVPGHSYILKSMDGTNSQFLQFIKKEPIDGEFVTVQDGTTNEEVLEVLIDRIKCLDNKASSPFNAKCLDHLKCALEQLNMRTIERQNRGVEGTPQV